MSKRPKDYREWRSATVPAFAEWLVDTARQVGS